MNPTRLAYVRVNKRKQNAQRSKNQNSSNSAVFEEKIVLWKITNTSWYFIWYVEKNYTIYLESTREECNVMYFKVVVEAPFFYKFEKNSRDNNDFNFYLRNTNTNTDNAHSMIARMHDSETSGKIFR